VYQFSSEQDSKAVLYHEITGSIAHALWPFNS